MSRRFGQMTASALLLAVVFVLFGASPAAAHQLDQSYIYVDIYDTELEGRLEFNLKELNAVLGLDLPTEDAEAAEAAVMAAGDEIIAYAEPRFGLGTDGVEWDIEFTEVRILDTESGIFAILEYRVDETFPAPPTEIDVRYEVFFDDVDDHVGLFHIGNYWEGGVFANEADAMNVLTPFTISNTSQTFDIDDPSFWRGLGGVVYLGIDHIRIGTDHILFVVALLLPSVLVFTPSGWQPTEGFRSSLWRVLKIVTSFTVAHSVTLTLAGLGVFELPSKPVETIIALSIILAALHNLHPVAVNKEWWLAFGFGLFHGLGFAGLLTELGLDRTNRVWSLFAFNVGVEIGQVVIILLVFPALYLLRQTRLFHVGFRVASVLLALVAFVWMMERILEADFRIDKLIDPFVVIPRAYVLAALLTAAAFAWRSVEERRGWLREPAVAPPPPEPSPVAELTRTG